MGPHPLQCPDKHTAPCGIEKLGFSHVYNDTIVTRIYYGYTYFPQSGCCIYIDLARSIYNHYVFRYCALAES